jgi:hypothetical protein
VLTHIRPPAPIRHACSFIGACHPSTLRPLAQLRPRSTASRSDQRSAAFWAADSGGRPPPGGRRLHTCMADRKAGDSGFSPELGLIFTPPLALGSGKLGTPCERMHFANARN